MFIEIPNRPKYVIIQKCSKANKWVDVAEIHDRCGMNYNYLREILETYNIIENALDWRAVVRSSKKPENYRQVLSLGGTTFYESLGDDILLSVVLKKDKYGNYTAYSQCSYSPIFYSVKKNPHHNTIEDFMKYVFEHGGIAKVHCRPHCEEDSYLTTYDIAFNDGTEVTIAKYYTFCN